MKIKIIKGVIYELDTFFPTKEQAIDYVKHVQRAGKKAFYRKDRKDWFYNIWVEQKHPEDRIPQVKEPVLKEITHQACGGKFKHLMVYVSTSSWGLHHFWLGNGKYTHLIDCPCCGKPIVSYQVGTTIMPSGNAAVKED